MVRLGEQFREWFPADPLRATVTQSSLPDKLLQVVQKSTENNPWFTHEAVYHALYAWGQALSPDGLSQWLEGYEIPEGDGDRKVAVIAAGNLPLVGLHDVLCVYAAGHKALCKLSSQDPYLLPLILEYLNPESDKDFPIRIPDWPMKDFDAVIATGSNNTNRYFEYYFGRYPHIFRRNRTSVALLSGCESTEDLRRLTSDFWLYFGLGCRSVSKIFVPAGYDFGSLVSAIKEWEILGLHHKFANNYHYQRAVHLMNARECIDTGNALLREDSGYHAPVSCLNYESYQDSRMVEQRLEQDQDQIQCKVRVAQGEGWLSPGSTQYPELTDYADGVDTMAFVLSLNQLHENA